MIGIAALTLGVDQLADDGFASVTATDPTAWGSCAWRSRETVEVVPAQAGAGWVEGPFVLAGCAQLADGRDPAPMVWCAGSIFIGGVATSLRQRALNMSVLVTTGVLVHRPDRPASRATRATRHPRGDRTRGAVLASLSLAG